MKAKSLYLYRKMESEHLAHPHSQGYIDSLHQKALKENWHRVHEEGDYEEYWRMLEHEAFDSEPAYHELYFGEQPKSWRLG
jgi:hypothetical protein